MKSNSWFGAWAPTTPKFSRIPDSGEGIHPRTRKIISYVRTDWIDGRLKPRTPGVYERQFRDGSTTMAYFAFWDGDQWSERQRHPEDLATRRKVRRVKRSSKQILPWRGLAHNPEVQYVAYDAAPGVPRDTFEFGGYVAQPEQDTHFVKVIHVAKVIRTPDGEYLTACGHRAYKGTALTLWGERGLEIMVRDGVRPELCHSCKRIAFWGDANKESNCDKEKNE